MSTFRFATVNVHSFRKFSIFDEKISDLVTILQPLDLDLIAVQEIQNNDEWQQFTARLSLNHSIYGACNEDYFGNGIASRYSFLSHSNQQSTACSGETRSLLQCRLDGDHPFIIDRTFAVTHLDHMNEDLRLEQIKQFNPLKSNIDILVGDMNSLTRDDYSDDYYRHNVEGKREKSYWETPRFDLTNLIKNEWGYQDAFRLFNPELKDEQVVTCDYGTRVDYIYLRPRANDQWALTKCEIIDTKAATDHNIVFAEFTQNSK